jgi:DNA-binding GntR family transcriptional regulator
MASEETVEITKAQLLAELLRAKRKGEKPEGALRTRDLSKILGWKRDVVRDALGELKEAGVIESVMVTVVTLDEKRQPIPHYRLIDGDETDKLVSELLGNAGQGE